MVTLYSEIRKEIKTGDLLAWKIVRIKTFFEFILYLYQKIFKAEFIHVGVAVVIGNKYFLVEATPPVVRLIPISMLGDFYLIKNNISENDNHITYLMQNIGKKYSLFDLLGSLFKIGNDENNYYCSELAGNFYSDIGFIVDEESDLTPDSLVKEIKKVHNLDPIFIKNDRGNLNGI